EPDFDDSAWRSAAVLRVPGFLFSGDVVPFPALFLRQIPPLSARAVRPRPLAPSDGAENSQDTIYKLLTGPPGEAHRPVPRSRPGRRLRPDRLRHAEAGARCPRGRLDRADLRRRARFGRSSAADPRHSRLRRVAASSLHDADGPAELGALRAGRLPLSRGHLP